MAQEQVQDKVLELNRVARVWVCSECGTEYQNIPAQCKCGGLAVVFNERDVEVGKDETRSIYIVETNILYGMRQINKGTRVSMVEKDSVTKTMVKNKLISPLKVEKPKAEK